MVSPSLGRFGAGATESSGATATLLGLSALPRCPSGGRGKTQQTENARAPLAGARETPRFLILCFICTWFAHECYICYYLLATTALITI